MRSIALFALLALATNGAPARGEFRLQEHLPPTTLVFAEIPDSAGFRTAFEKGRLYAFVRDEEVRRFFQPAWKSLVHRIEEATQEFERVVGIPWDRAWDLAKGQTAFAVVSAGPEKEFGLDFVLSMDCPGERSTLLKALEFVRSRYEKSRGKKMTSWTLQKQEVWEGEIADQVPFQIAVVGDVLLLANQKSTMGTVVKSCLEGPGKAFSESAGYQKARTRAEPTKDGLFLYANVPEILAQVEKRGGEDAKKVIDGLGLRGFSYVAGTVAPQGSAVRESFYLGISGERKGLAKLFSLKGAAPDLATTPLGAVQFSSLSIDLAELWETTIDVLKTIDETEHQRFTETIQRFEKDAGISIQNDLIPALGPRMYSHLVYPREGLVPDGIMVYEIRDREKLDRCLRAIAKNLQAEWAELLYQNWKIEYLKFFQASDDPLRAFLGSVYLLRTETHLYATGVAALWGGTGSGSPNALKRLLGRKDGPTLADDPELKAWIGGKTAGASAVFYADLQRGLVPWYNSLAPFAFFFGETLQAVGIASDSMELPLGETVGRVLSKSVTLIQTDAEGLAIRSASGSGLTLMTATFGVGILALALPVVQKAEGASRTRQCESNLYMIISGMYRHRETHGKFPEATGSDFFKALSEAGCVSEEVLRCPHSGKPYRGPASDCNNLINEAILLADDPESHPDGRIHVLTAGGSVQSVAKDDPRYAEALEGTKP